MTECACQPRCLLLSVILVHPMRTVLAGVACISVASASHGTQLSSRCTVPKLGACCIHTQTTQFTDRILFGCFVGSSVEVELETHRAGTTARVMIKDGFRVCTFPG